MSRPRRMQRPNWLYRPHGKRSWRQERQLAHLRKSTAWEVRLALVRAMPPEGLLELAMEASSDSELGRLPGLQQELLPALVNEPYEPLMELLTCFDSWRSWVREVEAIGGLMSDEAVDSEQQDLQCIQWQQEQQQVLDQARPALGRALATVNVITKADLTELKTLGKPPFAVEKTCQAVAIRFGMPAVWETIKSSLLGDPNLMARLVQFEWGNISDETVGRLQPILADQDLTPERLAQASRASVGLMAWVRGVVECSRVASAMSPIIKALDVSHVQLSEMRAFNDSRQLQLTTAHEFEVVLKGRLEVQISYQMSVV
ncbi:unnamed protein product [Polarella glacialis]|uniref:Dynein heavy chain coiled coil stalk domain-containing protein n=1 Tax=Polarella glacialis TaxID=89957 RepID=A0A813L3U9_POLGL|nr:unnamed protein product [Polarella glacialis]CAE8720952.1 unnamed protein product [Polarella glacialis]